MNEGKTGFGGEVHEGMVANEQAKSRLDTVGVAVFEWIRDGEVIERWEDHNLIVDQGLNYIRDAALLDGTAIGSWFMMLVDGGPTIAAGDTYATQTGWDEVTNYTEANRPAWQGAADGVGVATNSANRALFTIGSGGLTVGGIAIVGGGTDANTKGDTAGGGTLLEVLAFSGGDRSLQESDELRVTYALTAANAA
jgi:hypothetical protein